MDRLDRSGALNVIEVKRYETKDGRVHDSLEKARVHALKRLLEDIIAAVIRDGDDRHEIVEVLVSEKEVVGQIFDRLIALEKVDN